MCVCHARSTINGAIGALLPLQNRADTDFLIALERSLRVEVPLLAGREHLSFRSSYQPVKVRRCARECHPAGRKSAPAVCLG